MTSTILFSSFSASVSASFRSYVIRALRLAGTMDGGVSGDTTQQQPTLSAGAAVCYEPPGTQFELPFQWDDGTFVSPFVRSSGEALSTLAAYLAEFLLATTQDGGENGIMPPYVITDLGCGDGKALFEMCPVIQKRLGRSAAVLGAGYDLDEALIKLATTRNLHTPATACEGEETPRYTFAVRDICAMRVGDILEVGQALAGTPTPSPARHIVFVFLLTTALEQLKPLVVELLPRVELFISNAWAVPYLDDYLLAKVGTSYVYRWRDPLDGGGSGAVRAQKTVL